MNKKTRLIAAILSIACIFSSFCAFAENDVEKINDTMKNEEILASMKEEFELAEYLNVFTADDSTDLTGAVTKHEYVSALLKLFGFAGTENSEVEFPDIKKDADYYSDMVTAYSLGIIEGDDNGKYAPEGGVTIDTAAKMLVTSMGGFYRDFAIVGGGFPEGYKKMLNSMNALKNVKTADGYLTYAGMVQVFYNTLFAKTYTVSGDGRTIKESDETFLERMYNIKRYRGIVTSNSYFKQIEEGISSDGFIEIDGVRYKYGNADEEIVGQQVYYYVKYEDRYSTVNDGEVIILNPIEGKNSVLNIADEEIKDDSTMQRVNYVRDKENKVRSAKISSNAVFYYNGKVCFAMTDADMIPEIGRIRLVDNNDDGAYEYVFVYCYEEHLAEMSSMGKISDKYTSWTFYDNDSRYKIFRNNIEITADFIGEWDVLRVMKFKDEDRGIIEVSSDEVTGKITGITSDTVTIDNVEYDLSKLYIKAVQDDSFYVKKLEGGYSGIFATDGRGKITGVKTMKAGDSDYAFLVKAYNEPSEQKTYLKLYGMYGIMKKIPLVRKVQIDNEKYITTDEVPSALRDVNGKTINKLIKYIANSKGEITKIELPADRTAEGYSRGEFSLDYSYSAASGYFPYNLQDYTIAGYRVSQAQITPFFYIPADMSDDNSYQFFDAQKDFWNLNKDVNIEVYDSEKYVEDYSLKRAGAIVAYQRKAVNQPSNPYNPSYVWSNDMPYVITSTRQAINDDGELETIVEAYKDSTNMIMATLRFADKTYNCDTKNIYGGGNKKPEDLKVGDVIRIKYENDYAADKRVKWFVVQASVDKYTDPNLEYAASFSTTDGINPNDNQYKVLLGTVIYAADYEFIWKTKNALDEDKFHAVVVGYAQTGSVFIYDKALKKITVGTRKTLVKGQRAVMCGGFSQQFGTCVIVKE